MPRHQENIVKESRAKSMDIIKIIYNRESQPANIPVVKQRASCQMRYNKAHALIAYNLIAQNHELYVISAITSGRLLNHSSKSEVSRSSSSPAPAWAQGHKVLSGDPIVGFLFVISVARPHLIELSLVHSLERIMAWKRVIESQKTITFPAALILVKPYLRFGRQVDPRGCRQTRSVAVEQSQE